MATSCTTFATLTNTITTVTESAFTTTTESVTTPPGSVTTETVSTCVPVTIRSTTICSPTTTVIESTLPGVPSTVTVPVTGVTQIPWTTLATEFGSSCTTISTPPTAPPTSGPTPPPTTPPPPPTPSPTTFTSQTIITSDSSTYTSTFTTTSSFTPTSSTDVPPPTGTSNKSSAPIGAIVGGVVGGIAALAVLGILTWYLIRKQTGFDKFFNRDEDGTLNDGGPSLKPQPTDKLYNYQLVGENNTVPSNQLQGPGGFGQDIGNAPAQQPSAPGHVRTPSMTPLLVSVAGAAAASGAIAAATTASSRRSEDSSQPLGGPTAGPHAHAHAAPGAGGGPPSSYPPAMQNWQAGQNQGVYGPMHGQAQGFANVNAMGYPPGPPSNLTSMYTGSSGGPSTPGTMSTGLLGHNTSVSSGSVYSGNTSPPPSQWGGSAVNPPFGGPAILPVMTGMSQQSSQQQQHFGQPQQQQSPFGHSQQQPQAFGQPQQQQQPQFNSYPQQQQQQQHYDPYAQSHTGSSSASPEPQRPLQVINADPYTSGGSFAAYETAGSSSGAGASGSGSGSGLGAAGASSSAAAAAAVDGKGRPINTLGEKAPLVHLDGGMYQEPAPGQLPAGAAPPAYGE
ncbi:hypothetical protein CVT24_009233 [Panaeolus cyanescens]|uniref:Mid2 domain-containing protein n=1 Tax=Panaeolus cyanescens TaxID=181874 RepID=A0A409Y8F4_9AGAR|nr:hypothetical protein CVT24_009233 [Panaeolus cyanescens]